MPRTILIVDDIRSNREILKNILGGEYNIVEATHGREAIAIMRRDLNSLSAVLLDLRMPVMDGFEVLKYMRDSAELSQLPVIVMTGQTDADTEEQALKLGAKDYISKPYKSAIIKQRIWNTINLREKAATVNALRRDRLTGLLNREAFFEQVTAMVAAREPGYYVMACFDVEKFKVINDQYGTQKGDQVLKYIAQVFREGFESNGGVCCRVSADDFAILYPASFRDTEELREIRRKATLVDGLVTPISFSVGRYIVTDLSLSPSAMYDRAMMAAESIKGRYDVQVARYNESLRDQMLKVQEVVTDMEGALRERQFEVWYQPQYNHSTGALIGAEALARWRHPEKGIVSPGVFIPIFEKTGFVYALDRYVWEEVCRYLRREMDAGASPVPVSVNISRYDALRPDLIEVIAGLAKLYGIPVELLRLEITESAFAESTKEIVRVVKELIALGFTLEIDDFGSGYSSLNTLKSVPAQVVKMDMRFLEGDDDSQRGGNIIESVVRMTKWLGMSVIAEGVEKKAQADYLRSIGCNYVQGFLYAKPMPEAEYRALCHRAGADKEEKLLAMQTVENLNNDAFWDPESMDTLIFNSYVGAACVYEYHQGKIEMLRASEKFAQIIGGAGLTVEEALKLNWTDYLDAGDRARLLSDLERLAASREEFTGEYLFRDIPGSAREVCVRLTMRVIAQTGDRCLVYSLNENISAQRAAERREKKTSDQLQAVMDNVACGITAVSVEGEDIKYLLTNDRYYELLGYTKRQYEEEIGSLAFSTIAEEDRERIAQVVKRVAASGKPETMEYRAIRRDGTIVWLRSNVSMAVFEGESGRIQLSTYVDVTRQKTIERSLQDTAAQLRTMMDDIPGGYCRLRALPGEKLLPVFVNEGMRKLTGLGREAIEALFAKGAAGGAHPDDVQAVRDAMARLREHGEARSARYRFQRADGGWIWLRFFGRVSRDVQGDSYLNIYYSDATEQAKAEERQKEILDNLPYGVALFRYGEDGISVIHLNKRYWELVDRREDDFAGESPLDAVYAEDRPIIHRELEAALRAKRDVSCDLRILCAEGAYRPFHIAGRCLPDAQGGYSIYAAYTPISDEAMSVQEMLPIALSAMMDSQTGYSFVKDKNLRYICCSREAARLMKLSSAAEVAGKSDYDLFDKALADEFVAADRRLFETGKAVVDYTARIRTADGQERYANTSKFPLKDSKGNLVGLYGIGEDVTEARKMKAQFDHLTNSIPGGIASYEARDGKIRITYFNDGLCRLFELTREEYDAVSADSVFRGIFKEDLPALKEQLRALIESDRPVDCVYRVRLRSGAYKWVNLKASSAEREGGRVLFNAVLFDVTQRQDAMERMRISEQENRLAMRHTRNAVCRYDVAKRTLRIPEVAQKNFSLPEEIHNLPEGPIARGLISPETEEAYRAFYGGIHVGDETGVANFQRLSEKGWRWLEAHYSTIFSDTGEPVSAVISYTDITEQLEKDSAYKRWQQSFLGKPAASYSLFRCNLRSKTSFDSREGALLSVRFEPGPFYFDGRTAQYAAQYVLSEDRERFEAFLNVDALLAGYYQGKRIVTIEYRERLSDSEQRWLRLTVDLVEHAHADEIEVYLLFEDIDRAKRAELATLEQAETDALTGVMNRVTFAAQVKKLIAQSEPNAQHALLMLDIDGFKLVNDTFGHAAGDQVLVDTANALCAALRHKDLIGRLGGDEFLIFLTDIPGDAVAATKAKQICALTRKSFSAEVEISGSVGITVAPRDGTDFDTLYKKVDAALYNVKGSGKDNYAFYHDEMADEHLQLPRKSVSAPPKAEKKRRMLIVDDSRIDHALLTGIFAGQFIVEKAKDGASALIRLRHYGSAISVVLLDLVMPGMDGFEVLGRMQESAELRSIPVIVVSGDENRETNLRAIRAGAVDFVNKPVDPEILKIRVQSAISKAENERLRAKNSILRYQESEVSKYKSVLERSGVIVVENEWISGKFIYDPLISSYIAGKYDGRGLWHILLADFVADTATVKSMQEAVYRVASDRQNAGENVIARLKTPSRGTHWFRMSVSKLIDDFGLTGKVFLSFIDLGAELPRQL